MLPIAVFVLLVILAYIGVLLIRRLALRHRIIDHPKERSSHSFPMPRGGGLAIVVLVLVTSLWFAYETVLNRSLVYILLGAILAWVGWRDDIYSLSPKFRFLVQGLIALISIIVMGYFRVVRIPVFGDVDLGVIGILITFFWIIGMINAYNFMDGIDGMAGGVALSAGLCWMVLSSNVHNQFVFWVALSIAASSLGYLGHNWPPARIFMGDVASTFLGYSFAVLPLLSADQSGDALTIGTLLMWTVIIDPGATFIGRLHGRAAVQPAAPRRARHAAPESTFHLDFGGKFGGSNQPGFEFGALGTGKVASDITRHEPGLFVQGVAIKRLHG